MPARFSPFTRKAAGLVLGVCAFLMVLTLPWEGVALGVRAAAAVTVLVLILWITEPLPLYATALLPLLLFPILGVLPVENAAASYGDPTIFLFMGGFLIAAAMQRWNLHRRIALWIIVLTGTGPRNLVLGFMVATAFLSMWISNTAAAMMMIPIAVAMVGTLAGDTWTRSRTAFSTCLILAVAFAATIGGMATLIGTPPNGILLAQLSALFPHSPGIDFFSWMVFALPFSLIFLLIAWAWLTGVAFRNMPEVMAGGREVIREEKKALGPMSSGEKITLMVFVSVAVAWIMRSPKVVGDLTIPGLTMIIPGLTDAGVAIAGAILLFLIPAGRDAKTAVLDWETARNIPWGVLILFGGGICLSRGILESGLAEIIASHLTTLAGVPLVVLILILALVITFGNEVISNTAVASLLIPLVGVASVSMAINPLFLMVPVAIASSLGFMLPVGTPPNTIAYGTGYVSQRDMIRAGFALNVIGALLVTLWMSAVIPLVLGISPGMPGWAVLIPP